MAEEYGVRLKVTADTDEARRQMDELLDGKARRVQEATGGGGGRSPGGGVSDDTARRAGRAAGQEFEKTVGRGATGQMIGKAVAGFILHQGIGTAFSFARTPGGDNTSVDRTASTVGGALQFGTMGAMMGGPAGAAIGAVVGGLQGLIGQLGKEREDSMKTAASARMTALSADSSALSALGADARGRLLQWQGSRENRIEWLSGNRESLYERLRDSRRRLEGFGGDVGSQEYAYLKSNYERVSGEYATALVAEQRERMSPLYDPYGSGDFADSFSRRGLGVGPVVDVSSANDRIIEQQTRMVDLLQRIVDASNAGVGMGSQRLEDVLRDISDATRIQ